MIKKNNRKCLSVLLTLFLFLCLSSSVYAKAEKDAIYTVGKYHLDTFSSYIGDTEFSLGKMLFGKNGTDFIQMITNMSFSSNKIIWQVFDFIIEKLYKGAAMDELIHTFFQFSKNIYDKLFNVVGLGLTGLYVVYIFYLKVCRSGNQARRTLVRFLCVVGFSILWFGNGTVTSQGEKLTKDLNTWSTAVEGLIFEATNGIDDLSVATSSEEAVNQIREMYYQKAVVDPYLLLNYGTTNIEELTKAGIKPTEFLSKSIKNEDLKNISTVVTEAAGEDDEKKESYRAFIQPTKSIYKMIVGIMSPILNVSLGIPILMIGMVRFLFQLGVLLMLLAIAFMLIVSFFPGMDYMIFRGVKTFVGFVFQKSIYSVLILVAFLVFNIIDDLIMMNTIAGFIGNMFVRGIVSLIVFLKRKDILAKLGLSYADRTLSKAKTKAQNTTKEVTQTIHRGKDLTERAILKGASIAGKIHPGIIAASQLYQRTKQQRTTPVKNQNTKVTEIAYGRKKQLPYERKQLVAEVRPTIGTPPSPLSRKVAEPISDPSKAVIKENIPLPISSLPIDRLINNRKTPNVGNQKLVLAKPAKNHVGNSIPLRLNTPQLIANDSLTQQITQLKQSRALVNQHTSLHSMQRVSDHSRNDRTIKMTGSSKKLINDNPRSSDHSSSIVSGKMIEAKIGSDFTLPKGRSPQK
ncbi:transposase [Enterococcus raffinosus]|uniref:CD3337/EF1877 family mobilome membrane protein n=1 Tax=Enterococcus raffinosus TaxID=71452 RepID=UPI0028921C1D|nr:transposase [Enterococcus raffinosus]MDT2557050.1 transposase [Enterococcus raffinosus]